MPYTYNYFNDYSGTNPKDFCAGYFKTTANN